MSEKINDPILKKVSDGWTDRRTGRQIDESDFTGCCPTIESELVRSFFPLLDQFLHYPGYLSMEYFDAHSFTVCIIRLKSNFL